MARWYVLSDGFHKRASVDDDTMTDLIAAGIVTGEAKVMRQGEEVWVCASERAEWSGCFQSHAPSESEIPTMQAKQQEQATFQHVSTPVAHHHQQQSKQVPPRQGELPFPWIAYAGLMTAVYGFLIIPIWSPHGGSVGSTIMGIIGLVVCFLTVGGKKGDR